MKRPKIKSRISTRLILYISLMSAFIYIVAVGFILINNRINVLDDAKEIVDITVRENTEKVKRELNKEIWISRTLTDVFKEQQAFPKNEKRFELINKIIENVLLRNDQFFSVWVTLEISALDSAWKKPYGRYGIGCYRGRAGNIEFNFDIKDTLGPSKTSVFYNNAKAQKAEIFTDPYYFSYTGEEHNKMLESSVGAPIMVNEKFIGLAGVDVILDRFQGIIEKIKPYEGSEAFLIAGDGTYVAAHRKDLIGKKLQEVNQNLDQNHLIFDRIQDQNAFSFETKDSLGHIRYYSFLPFTLTQEDITWTMGISVPRKVILQKANSILFFSIIIGIVGLLLLAGVIWYIATNLTKPLKSATSVLEKIAHGDINSQEKLRISTGDEIEQMATSVNKLVEGLKHTVQFSEEIGKGNLSAEYKLLGENDVLGYSLMGMRDSLKNAEKEEKEREEENKKRNWISEGIAKFADLLRKDNDDINKLAYNVIYHFTKYMNALIGGIYILNESDENHKYLELKASYAFDRQKFIDKKIEIGEGLVGACFLERKPIFLNKIPESYISLTSGLGETTPRYLFLFPLLMNDEIFGVVELASFNNMEEHMKDFAAQACESIASTIASVQINMNTSKLLKDLQQEQEKTRAQEEEMRQNMEEMQSVQEEMQRMNNEMSESIILMDSLLSNIPAYIYFKDEKSRFIKISNSMVKLFPGASSTDDLVGKSDFDFHTRENAEKFFREEKEIMETRIPIINRIVKEKLHDGSIQWVSQTKMPLINKNDEVIGIFGISKDITDLKQIEEKAQLKTDALNKQEKEMQKTIDRINESNAELREKIALKEAEIQELRKNTQK